MVNTILALCGATIITYLFSTLFRKGKPAIADIANASLAGGVHNLHGMPGLLGGIISGNIIRFTGSKVKVYEDSDEFADA